MFRERQQIFQDAHHLGAARFLGNGHAQAGIEPVARHVGSKGALLKSTGSLGCDGEEG